MSILIKEVSQKNFEIQLLQMDNGAFVVISDDFTEGSEYKTSDIFDFHQASWVFDTKLRELQGH